MGGFLQNHFLVIKIYNLFSVDVFEKKQRQAATWNPLLQCLHLDKHLLQQRNTNKLQGTKNNCMHAQLGQIRDKIQKRPKTQLPLLKSQEQKQGVSSKGRLLCMPPTHTTTIGVGKPLRHDPWIHPYPHPM